VHASKPLSRRVAQRTASKQIVESIMDAASELLRMHPIEVLTTNQIAARAGISVGSLYQYFANKQAVLSSVAARLEHRTLDLFTQRMAQLRDASLETITRSLIELLSTEQLGAVRFRRELLAHVPRGFTEEISQRVDREVAAALTLFLASHPEVRQGRAELMAFVIVHSVEAVVEAAVLRRQELIGSPLLLDELTRMVLRYVTS